jgi:hypothetical protein
MDDNASSYTVLDSSGNGRDAALFENTDTIFSAGLVDGSLISHCYFGGLTVNESIPTIMANNFSFAVWMKLDGTYPYTGIFFSPAHGNYCTALINQGGGYMICNFGGNGVSFNVNVMPAWHHIVFVKSGSTFTVYYDGTSLGSSAIGENYTTSWVWFDSSMDYYNHSEIDELIFYSRSLTAQQVTDLYSSYDGPTFGTLSFNVGAWMSDMGLPGACNLEYSSKMYVEGTEIGTFPTVVSNDPRYSFSSWHYEMGDYLYTYSPVYDGLVAYASWVTVSPLCTLYFDSQGGSSGWEYWDLYEGFTFEIPYLGHFWPADPVYEGYVFGGWFSGSGGTGSPINPQGIYESMIFGTGYMYAFAYWTLPPITFTFTSGVPPLGWGTEQTDIPDIENYVTYDYTEISYGSGAEITALPSASVTGPRYTFTGYWYEPYYCVVYQVGSYAPQNNDPFGGPIPLYAMWTDNGYQGQVTFDLQGGSGETPTINLFEGYTFSTGDFGQMVWPTAPTYDGYTFGGWWTDVGGTGSIIEYDTTWTYSVYPLSMTLYAYWIAN